MVVVDGLRETDFGEWEGLTFREASAEVAGRAQGVDRRPGRRASRRGVVRRGPTGRVADALAQLFDERGGQRLLVVSHVTPIKLLIPARPRRPDELALPAAPRARVGLDHRLVSRRARGRALVQHLTLDDYAELSGHVIVSGLSNLGLRIAEQLHEAGVPCVLVDDGGEERARRQLERLGVPVVRESSRFTPSLEQAGIAAASAIIAAHDSDLDNLETALLVADLTADGAEHRVVVRLANPRLAEQLTAALPAAHVLSLPEKAGSSFVEGCIQSALLHAFPFEHERMEVVEYVAGSTTPDQRCAAARRMTLRTLSTGSFAASYWLAGVHSFVHARLAASCWSGRHIF